MLSSDLEKLDLRLCMIKSLKERDETGNSLSSIKVLKAF